MGIPLLRNLSLFSGAGGLEIAARLVGSIRTVCYVENDAYCQAVLMSRIRDGSLDDAPIWDDVRTFDGKPWNGRVDIVSGGFPCTDISRAQSQFINERKGLDGKRSGLFYQLLRIVSNVGSKFILLENVSSDVGWIPRGIEELRKIGYLGRTTPLCACAFGAPHPRERVFIVAYSMRLGLAKKKMYESLCQQTYIEGNHGYASASRGESVWKRQMRPQSCVCGMVDGLAFQLDRIRACGNGVVAFQAIPAWEMILRLSETK